MSQGARNWPFFTLIAAPVAPAASRRSVWRERKAGICRTSTASATGAQSGGQVDVGQDRAADAVADGGEHREALVHADAALGAERGAVGLVVGALEDQAAAGVGAGAGEDLGDHERVVEGLELAGAGDQRQRQAGSDRDLADPDDASFSHGTLPALDPASDSPAGAPPQGARP